MMKRCGSGTIAGIPSRILPGWILQKAGIPRYSKAFASEFRSVARERAQKVTPMVGRVGRVPVCSCRGRSCYNKPRWSASLEPNLPCPEDLRDRFAMIPAHVSGISGLNSQAINGVKRACHFAWFRKRSGGTIMRHSAILLSSTGGARFALQRRIGEENAASQNIGSRNLRGEV